MIEAPTSSPLSAEQWIAFHLNPWMQAALCILVPMALACLALLIVRRFVHTSFLRKHHDIAGPYFNTLGTIYGIFLAFIVSNTWHYYDQTSSNIVQEARCYESLHNDTEAFSEPFRSNARTLLRQYRDSIVSKEWPRLEMGSSSAEANMALRKLTDAYAGHQVSAMGEQAFFTESVKNLEQLKALRASRIDDAASGLLPFLWFVLIAGAVVTVGFSFLFGAENFITHAVMTLLLTGLIGLTFFTIITLDFPFTGFVAIGPDQFLKATSR